MFRKILLSLITAGAMAVPALAPADDTDIYIDPNRPKPDQPLVMFSLDYRANLTSTANASVGTYFCKAGMGTEVDELSKINGGGVLGADCDVSNLKLFFFDTLILTLKLVLSDIKGVKIGLMLNHNDAGKVGTPITPRKCKGATLRNEDCIANGLTASNKDCDGDGFLNSADACPTTSSNNNSDTDGDLCGDSCDNCPANVNATQDDTDSDGIGDACDASPDGAGDTGFSLTPKSSNGGVVMMGFQTLDDVDTLVNFKKKLVALKHLKNEPSSPDHPYQGSELFFEFFRYLTGQGIYNGHNGVFDYESGNTIDESTNMRCESSDTDINPACWDKDIETGTRYLSPIIGLGDCAKIFTVNFLFQVSQSESDAGLFTQAKGSGGLGLASEPSSQNDYFPAILAYLRDADLGDGTYGTAPAVTGKQNVTSYFLVDPTKINITTNGYATAGGTGSALPLADDPEVLVETLRNIFEQILSVSTTFVAASVPVNVFNRAEIVDNVYFALFQAERKPRWNGNLKKFKLAAKNVTDAGGNVVGQTAIIVDANNAQAISTTDGRVLKTALSFWTDNSLTKLDAGDSNGDAVTDMKDTNSDGLADNVDATTGNATFPTPGTGTAANPQALTTDRDGRSIARGGAGQKMPGFITGGAVGDANPGGNAVAAGPRKMFYLSSSASAASLQPLNAASSPSLELKAQLGDAAMADADAQQLLRFTRGQDTMDEDKDCPNNAGVSDACYTEPRYWILGDPLHARPLPVNYGAITVGGTTHTTTNPAIFIAMAGNDGALHLFRNTTTGSVASDIGQEVWAFVPPEGLAIQRRLMDNDEGDPSHPSGFDGEPTAVTIDQDGDGNIESGDRVILFIGVRRGATRFDPLNHATPLATEESSYYAIDITDPLTPKLQWRITPTTWTIGADVLSSGNPGSVTTSTQYAEMALTFSRPRVGSIQTGTNPDGSIRRRLAVFFGGGYNGGYVLDSDGNVKVDSEGDPLRVGKDQDGVLADDTRGNAIYVAAANTGQLLWKAVGPGSPASASATVYPHAEMRDSIPSNLTIADTDADGVIDRIYVGDTGGNVWRADLGPDTDATPNGPADDWRVVRLACLGRHGGAGCADLTSRLNDRRFFHEPDLVQTRDGLSRFDAVIMGSGDREDPLDQGGDVDNWFFVMQDANVGVDSPGGQDTDITFSQLNDVTSLCLNNESCTITSPGWRLALNHAPDGEKALSAPVTIANSIFFTTYLPPGKNELTVDCGPVEGSGLLYGVNLLNASPVYNYDTTNPEQQGSDRSVDLGTPGIPAQVVFLGSPSALGGGGGGGGSGGSSCELVFLAGAKIFEAPGCPRFRTFWQRVGQ